MNKQAVLSSQPVSNLYASVTGPGPQHTQAGMPGPSHGPSNIVQQSQGQLQSRAQSQTSMQSYYPSRQNAPNAMHGITRSSGMATVVTSAISSNAHHYTNQIPANVMYASQPFGNVNPQTMMLSPIPMAAVQYSQNQFTATQYPLSSTTPVVYRSGTTTPYYNPSGTVYFPPPVHLSSVGRTAVNSTGTTGTATLQKREKKIICIQDESGRDVTQEIMNEATNKKNTVPLAGNSVAPNLLPETAPPNTSIAAQFAEQVAAAVKGQSKSPPLIMTLESTETVSGKQSPLSKDSKEIYEDSAHQINSNIPVVAQNSEINLKSPPPLIPAKHLGNCVESEQNLQELICESNEKSDNFQDSDNIQKPNLSEKQIIEFSENNSIALPKESTAVNEIDIKFICEDTINSANTDTFSASTDSKTIREQVESADDIVSSSTETTNDNCKLYVTELNSVCAQSEISVEDSVNIEISPVKTEAVEEKSLNTINNQQTNLNNHDDNSLPNETDKCPDITDPSLQNEEIKPEANGDISVIPENKQEAKDNKRGKGKKWKDLNKKGENKEGGDMDAFLDKPNVINQVSVSPVPPKSPALEMILTSPPNEKELEASEEERKVAEKNEENIRVTMEAQLTEKENEIIELPQPETDSVLKYNYSEDQWSPINPEGKKKYDRSFLLNMQAEPLCLQKPKDLPSVYIIKDEAYLQKLPGNNKPAVTPLQARNYSDPFIPNFATRQSRPPPGGVGRRQSQQGRDKPKKIITISNSFNQDVKLHECSNAWKPVHTNKTSEEDEEAKTNDLYKKVRGILNKLTPQKFQKLVEQVRQLPIDTEDRLNGVIDLVFEKAVDEPNFSVPYANMCKHLAMVKVPLNTNSDKGQTTFRKLILTKCQKEFEKDSNDEIKYEMRLQQIEKAETGEKKKQLREELQEEERKARFRSLGNIKFIGELFKLNMLTAPIMHECLKKLLRQGDEDSLECLCRLVTTIGKELEADKSVIQNRTSSAWMESYFEAMKEIVAKRQTSSRVRFMLQDVIDLRQNNWIPRRDENNPKTIDQIHLEAHRELQEQEQRLQQTPFQKRSMDDRGSNRKGRGSSNYQDDGWSMQSSKNKSAIDPSKLKLPKSMGESDIQLGRGFAKWGQGSSGGNIKNTNEETEAKSTVLTNRFSALASDQVYSSFEPRRGSQRSAASSRESSRSGGNPPPPLRKSSSQTSTKERKQVLEAVKDITKSDVHINKSASSRTSEQQSNENGLVLKGKEFSEEEMEKKVKSLIDEYLHNPDFKETVLCVAETVSPSSAPFFVSSAILHVLERSSQSRHLVGQLMQHLVKKKILQIELYIKGLKSVLETADDCAIDVPKIWQYLGEIIEPMIQDNTISLIFLKDVVEPCIATGTASKLVSEVLHAAAKNQGNIRVAQLWKSAGLQWSDFLSQTENVTEFVKLNQLEYTIIDVEAAKEKLSFTAIKEKLDTLFQRGADNEIIFDWIDANVDTRIKEPKFIRALTSSLVENVLEGDTSSNNFDKKKLTTRLPLLQKCVDQDNNLELQVLYALQALVNRLEHPKGLLIGLFEFLFDEDLISDDAITTWAQSTDPAEQEGKGVALKSVTSFLTWLKEQDDDSLEDN